MSNINRFGLDLAKSSFAVCGVGQHGKVLLRKTLSRSRLLEFFANVPPAVVAMEAGSGAHHWARELIGLGHDARIIDPRLVAPYRHQGRISKRGDTYLRTLLVHGARSELMYTAGRTDRKSRWAESLKSSKSWNKAAVALANKHARIAWTLLANDQAYLPT